MCGVSTPGCTAIVQQALNTKSKPSNPDPSQPRSGCPPIPSHLHAASNTTRTALAAAASSAVAHSCTGVVRRYACLAAFVNCSSASPRTTITSDTSSTYHTLILESSSLEYTHTHKKIIENPGTPGCFIPDLHTVLHQTPPLIIHSYL